MKVNNFVLITHHYVYVSSLLVTN